MKKSISNQAISKLYKYLPFSERTLDILRSKSIWFPKAETLNDLFEFSFRLSEMKIYGIAIDKKSFEEAIRVMKQQGVLSLSEINNNILMWSHYSSSHTGFCIEFERTNSNELGSKFCMPVNYSEHPLEFTPLDLENKNKIVKIMTTKSTHWSYELEWRMIAKNGDQIYPLPSNITGVVFGFRMDIRERRKIVEILGESVSYMQAVMDVDKYELEILPTSLSELLA